MIIRKSKVKVTSKRILCHSIAQISTNVIFQVHVSEIKEIKLGFGAKKLIPGRFNFFKKKKRLRTPLLAICTDTDGSFECSCQDGYELSTGSTCIDINECLTTDICGSNSACENFDGGYECQCLWGFEANSDGSIGCQDIDECQVGDPCQEIAGNQEGIIVRSKNEIFIT